MRAAAALVREPLVQFVAIGTLLASLYALVPQEPATPAARPAPEAAIVVTEGRIEQLASLFERTWQRPPTQEELDGLVDSFVREEVLYRAGTALGLGEDDQVVRRRIAQKMEFLLEPAPGEIVPTEEDLARHLATFPERFREPPRVTFEQIFVDPARHGGTAEAALGAVEAALGAGEDPASLGDPTLIPAAFEDEPVGSLTRLFGEAFAARLLEVPAGEWTGPLPSPYGVHLVRVGARTEPRDPPLAEIRDAVAEDWEAVRRRAVADERLAELMTRYTIDVERPAAEPGAPAARADERAAAADEGAATR